MAIWIACHCIISRIGKNNEAVVHFASNNMTCALGSLAQSIKHEKIAFINLKCIMKILQSGQRILESVY